MKKFYKIMGIITGALLICGIIFAGVGIGMGGLNHTFKNSKYNLVINPTLNEKEYTVLDEFDTVDLTVSLADVQIIKGDEFAIEYVLYGEAEYSVDNGIFVLNEENNNWINVGLSLKTEKTYIKLYVPGDCILNIRNITADMGVVTISGIEFTDMNIGADMGEVNLDNITVQNLDVHAGMGKVYFNGTATGKICIAADMGDIELKGYLGCDIEVDSDMGAVDITTYYNKDSYRYDISTDMGSEEINDKGGEKTNKNYTIDIDCDMGDAVVTFTNP